jgi:hypothetical protein
VEVGGEYDPSRPRPEGGRSRSLRRPGRGGTRGTGETTLSQLDLLDDDVGRATADELNARATSDEHGWEALPEYERKATDATKVVVSFDSREQRDEFYIRFGAHRFSLDAVDVVDPNQEAIVVDDPGSRGRVLDTDHWDGMPLFVLPDERISLTLAFDDEEARAAFLKSAGIATVHKGTRGTLSVWWPDRAKEDLSSLKFVATGEVEPRYPIYVPSRGRAHLPLTARFLARDRVPFRLVVEREQLDEYRAAARRDGFADFAEILTLPESGQGLIYSRNWIRDHAEAEGAERHWQLDDNIGQVRRLYGGKRIPCESGPALAAVEAMSDRYDNVAFSGLNYQMFVTPTSPPYRANVHVYSGTLVNHAAPFRWRLLYNDDVDVCLQALDAGWATILVSAFMIDKKTTMTIRGGNTDGGGPIAYVGDGRTKMAQSLRALWPNYVRVKRRFGRDQHVVDWGVFRSPLRPRPDADPGPGERGLSLRKISEPRSESLRCLYDEYCRARCVDLAIDT